MHWHIFLTAWGWAAVLGTKEIINASVLPVSLTILSRYIESTGHAARLIAMHDHSWQVINKFRAYYEGAVIEDWETELNLDAFPPFSRRIMELARAIPYGQTMTYAEVARTAEKPRAARAVGQVMKRNPFPLLVPCHRVVASNGPGGFTSSGGVQTKLNMLRWERKNLAAKGIL